MNVVFVAEFMFPYGSANAMRTRSIYQLLETLGHNVYVISDCEGNGTPEENAKFNYESIYHNHYSLVERLIVPYKSVRALRKYCDSKNVDLIITNAEATRFNLIASFCRKRGIKLVVENCEWYDYSNFKFKKCDSRYIKYQKMIKSGFKKADGFISISRFLDEHNKKFAESIRIPTILDVKNSNFSLSVDNEKLQIVYTGSPGKSKEFLRPVCEALANDDTLREKLVFNIYGPSYNQVLLNIGDEEILKKCGESVVVHGRVPQNEIKNILINADFLLFLRPQRRSSQAGFPTKLGESFAVGTPVISNDTGDIGLYLKDEYNGYLLKDINSDTVVRALTKALDYKSENPNMRKNARITAENHFDFRVYTDDLTRLLNGVF